VPKILIVGGGYAGFYTAFKLEKWLRNGEAEVTIVDPLPYMTYQPFLPEVAAGSIEPRHAIVGLRRHLERTRVVAAKVSSIDHVAKTATITPKDGDPWVESYDIVVVTAGAVSRTFPIPGIADQAIGLKTIEEATAIRDRLTDNFERASTLPAGPERDKLLTVVVVGGGFAGIEIFGELRSFASSLLGCYPSLTIDDTHFHLVEAMERIMPEVSLKTSYWVLKNLAEREAIVHLSTQLTSAVDGKIELSTGESFAWGAGDVSAVPDLTGGGVGGFCVPNAQHAVRQGKLLAKNIAGSLRGELPAEYFHKNQGAVAGIGLYIGVFQSRKLAVKGLPAWFMHRGYHGLAIPTWERKIRIFSNWILAFLLKRDMIGIIARDEPRAAFEEFATRPKAAPAAAKK
jgi:NADH:ubiquinone reductase (H+-translocating)